MRRFINIVESASRRSAAERFIERAQGLWDDRYVRIDLWPEDDFDVAIQKLYVEPQWRGQGLAPEALKALGKLADRMGISLYLEALPDEEDEDVDQDRERLIAFYRRCGFEGGGGDGMMWRSPKPRAPKRRS
jgi:GNAT superfamily N-acetyltransferase